MAIDYLGVDYYDPFLSHALRLPDFSDLEFKSRSISAHLFDVLTSKWWDWHFLPEGMSAFCSYYAKAFPGLGILIAENGMSQRCSRDNAVIARRPDGLTRSDYLEAHLREVRGMLDQGVPPWRQPMPPCWRRWSWQWPMYGVSTKNKCRNPG